MNILQPSPIDAGNTLPKLPADQLTGQAVVNAPTAAELLAEKAIPAAQSMVPEASPVAETAPTPEVKETETAPSINTLPNDTVGKPDYLLPAQQPQETAPAVDSATPPTPAAPPTPETTAPTNMPPTPTDSIEGASI